MVLRLRAAGQIITPRSGVEFVKLNEDLLLMVFGSNTPEFKVEYDTVFMLAVDPVQHLLKRLPDLEGVLEGVIGPERGLLSLKLLQPGFEGSFLRV